MMSVFVFWFKLCEVSLSSSGQLIEFMVYVHAYSTFHSHKRGLLVSVHFTDLSSLS